MFYRNQFCVINQSKQKAFNCVDTSFSSLYNASKYRIGLKVNVKA